MVAFRPPIEYAEGKQELSQTLIDDLELEASRSGGPSLYSAVFGEACRAAGRGRMEKRWARWFTSDRGYLEDTQALLATSLGEDTCSPSAGAPDNILSVWKEIEKHDSGSEEEAFHSQYLYVEWGPIRWANRNARLLWFLSLYNVGGPVLSLSAPIFMLMIPFCVLRIGGRPLTLQSYIGLLKSVLAKHPIGQVFSFRGASAGQKLYIAFSIVFYGFQVYQNMVTCIRFWKNRRTIEGQLRAVAEHLERAVLDMDTLARATAPLTNYSEFRRDLSERATRLNALLIEINAGLLHGRPWWRKAMAVGEQLRLFYRIYRDKETRQDLDYSLDALAYLGELRKVQALINSGRVSMCRWSRKGTVLKGVSLPGPDTQAPGARTQVQNDCDLRTSLLVTGPNASGKTTVLKATLFNLILSQQIGGGFYTRASVKPFDRFHCYMNIPDTNDRDSLFQAEARRCRQILSDITERPKTQRHFCVFDELYSGTNPSEAIGGATAFLRHIARKRGVRFMMTTHFTELCRKLEKGKHVRNYHMDAVDNGDEIEFKYKMVRGTTRIRGGVHVLRQLDYPLSIIEEAVRETACVSY